MFKLRSFAIAAFAVASITLAGCSNANSIAPQPATHSGAVSHPLCSIVPQQPDCAK
jgi:outer membrane murein-binding lipoprotein Lpp